MKVFDRNFGDDYYNEDIGYVAGARELKRDIKKKLRKFRRVNNRRICRAHRAAGGE